MIEIEIEIDQLEALLAHIASLPMPRDPLLEVAYMTLKDAHADAAEQYWTEQWSY